MRDFDDLVGRQAAFDAMGQGYPRYDLVGQGYPRYDLIGQPANGVPRIGATSDAPFGAQLVPLGIDENAWQNPMPFSGVQLTQQPAFGVAAKNFRQILVGYLGFPLVDIEGGECVTTAVTAETLLKVTRFVIDSAQAHDLLVEDIKVGRDSILLGAAVPAIMFSQDSTIQDIIATETVQEGTTISIALRNCSDVKKTCVSIGATARYAKY